MEVAENILYLQFLFEYNGSGSLAQRCLSGKSDLENLYSFTLVFSPDTSTYKSCRSSVYYSIDYCRERSFFVGNVSRSLSLT